MSPCCFSVVKVKETEPPVTTEADGGAQLKAIPRGWWEIVRGDGINYCVRVRVTFGDPNDTAANSPDTGVNAPWAEERFRGIGVLAQVAKGFAPTQPSARDAVRGRETRRGRGRTSEGAGDPAACASKLSKSRRHPRPEVNAPVRRDGDRTNPAEPPEFRATNPLESPVSNGARQLVAGQLLLPRARL